EEVTDGIAGGGHGIGDELAAIHVDADAVLLAFIGGPVEAEAPLELVEAALAEHDVVAGKALHAVALGAVEHVVTGIERDLAGRRAHVTDQEVAAAAAVDPVVAFVALDLVIVLAAEDDVVAQSSGDVVDALAAVDQVVVVAAEDRIVPDAGIDDVVACIAVDDV